MYFKWLISLLTIVNTAALSYILLRPNNSLPFDELDDKLEEFLKRKSSLLIDILNQSANKQEQQRIIISQKYVIANKQAILKLGVVLKEQSGANTMVIFGDLLCQHCLAFLKNVKLEMANLNANIIFIPISIMGEESLKQAKLFSAAALQNIQKALSVALAYDSTIDAENSSLQDAKVLGLNVKLIEKDMKNKALIAALVEQNKVARGARILSIPTIFILTADKVYEVPPGQAKDLASMVGNPKEYLALQP